MASVCMIFGPFCFYCSLVFYILGAFLGLTKNAFIMPVTFENFGLFIDTDLAPPKSSSGAKLFRANDVIFIDHVLNLVLTLSLLCLRNKFAMCVVSSRSPVFMFASRPGVLFCCVLPSLRVCCAFMLNSGLCIPVYFICSQTRSPRLWDVNRGNSCI